MRVGLLKSLHQSYERRLRNKTSHYQPYKGYRNPYIYQPSLHIKLIIVVFTWNCPLTVLEGPWCLLEAALARVLSKLASTESVSLYRKNTIPFKRHSNYIKVLTSLGAVFQYFEAFSLFSSPPPTLPPLLPMILRVLGHLFLSFSCRWEMEGSRFLESILDISLFSLETRLVVIFPLGVWVAVPIFLWCEVVSELGTLGWAWVGDCT